MYRPPVFNEEDRTIAWELLEEIRLGSLISFHERLLVSHLPIMVDRGRGTDGVLIGHMARNNPQWRDIGANPSVLVTFLGPNSYISPSWYATSPRAPTWNFVAIHVYGTARLVEDLLATRDMVMRLSETMEPPDSSWKASTVDPSYIDRLLPGIIGFEVDVVAVETQLRLSQQNGIEDRTKVHAALRSGDVRQRQVAELMTRYSFRDQKDRTS